MDMNNHIFLSIKELTVQKKTVYAVNVGKLFVVNPSSLFISEFIQGRDLMNVLSVKEPSAPSQTLTLTREFIQEKNPTRAVNVAKSSLSGHSSLSIRKSTQEGNLMGAVTVGKPIAGSHSLFYTREVIQE